MDETSGGYTTLVLIECDNTNPFCSVGNKQWDYAKCTLNIMEHNQTICNALESQKLSHFVSNESLDDI